MKKGKNRMHGVYIQLQDKWRCSLLIAENRKRMKKNRKLRRKKRFSVKGKAR